MNKKNVSGDPFNVSVNRTYPELSGGSSRPDPEEGHRLMRSFLSVRQPALRQAIVQLVAELSTHYGERQ